jgi:hypothetical protein
VQNNIQTKTFAMELGTLAPLIELLATDGDDMVQPPTECRSSLHVDFYCGHDSWAE